MTRPPKTIHLAAVSLTLALVTLITYWPVVTCDFMDWDDQYFVFNNPVVQSGLTLAGFKWVWHSVVCANWHPVTMLSHMLDCQLFEIKPAKHHFANLLFHIANALLLFFLLRRLTGVVWRSVLVAALFALHPLRVESVAWIAERKDVLCTFFVLLTIWAYAAWVRRRSVGRYLLVLALYALALMSKPMAVTLPFVLLLLDFWPLKRVEIGKWTAAACGKLVVEKIPLFLMSAALCVATFVLQHQAGSINSTSELPAGFQWTNPFISYLRYIGMLVWPTNLAIMYMRSQPWPLGMVALAVVCLISISVAAVRLARRRPYFVIGWFLYLGTLVPVIGFVPQGDQCMADRYTYIPMIGLLIVLVWGGWDLAQKWQVPKMALSMSMLLVLGASAAMTHQQIGFWRDTETMFNHIAVPNRDALAYNAVGCFYQRHNRHQEATANFAEALKIRSTYFPALNNLGMELAAQGRFAEAQTNFQAALAVNPKSVIAENNLAHVFLESGHANEAVSHYQHAVQLDPNSFDSAHGLGICYAMSGKMEEAVQALGQAVRIDPANAMGHLHLAKALLALNRVDEAKLHCQEALRLNPNLSAAQQVLDELQKK